MLEGLEKLRWDVQGRSSFVAPERSEVPWRSTAAAQRALGGQAFARKTQQAACFRIARQLQGWLGSSRGARGAEQRPAPPPRGARFWRPAPRAPRPGRSFLAPRTSRPSYGELVFGAPRPGRLGAPANLGQLWLPAPQRAESEGQST